MAICRCPLLRLLLGVKRTYRCALQMSAYDPKRTWDRSPQAVFMSRLLALGPAIVLKLASSKFRRGTTNVSLMRGTVRFRTLLSKPPLQE
jgi:hypothetical protein